MTVSSPEDQSAASTEFGPFLTETYITALRQMIQASESSRLKKLDRHGDVVSLERWALWDFCRLGIAGGRQTGKTLAIQTLVEKDDLVIAYSPLLAEDFVKTQKRANQTPSHVITSWTMSNIIKSGTSERVGRPKRIWIDDATYAFEGRLRRKELTKWILANYELRHLPTIICVN